MQAGRQASRQAGRQANIQQIVRGKAPYEHAVLTNIRSLCKDAQPGGQADNETA
jgi:hypothetical protein